MTPGLRLLAVGALPLLYIAFELGWLATKGRRRAALGLALLLIAAALPWQGVDFAYLKRANLLLVGTVVMVLALRLQGTRWLTEEREKRLLLVAAVSAVILFTNFFSFHGKHTWVHYHDVAHYYLGGKYFRELSYDGPLHGDAARRGGASRQPFRFDRSARPGDQSPGSRSRPTGT